MALSALNKKEEEADDNNDDDWYSDHDLLSVFHIFDDLNTTPWWTYIVHLKHYGKYDAKWFWNIHFCK